MKRIYNYIILFITFGLIYFVIECIWKGKISDWRMAMLGAFLGVLIGVINNAFSYKTDILLQGLIGSMAITLAEAIWGYQWNTIEQRHIWDYSSLPLNGVDGNVSFVFSVFCWIPLSYVAILIDDCARYYLFKDVDEQPYYILFGRKILTLPKRKL